MTYFRKKLIIVSVFAMLQSGGVLSRDYQYAGANQGVGVLVETEQLKSCLGVYPLVCIKWIKHYRTPRDYGLEQKVVSEGMDSFAVCDRRTVIRTAQKRFNALGPDGYETIKVVDLSKPMKKGADFSAYIQSLRAEPIEPNSPAAIAVEYACTWADANK